MKVTFDIDEIVLRELRETAAREGTTVSALVETALREFLASIPQPKPSKGTLEPRPSWDRGGELVDVSDRDALYAAMEEEE